MQIVDYNPFARKFAVSRKDMQWPEIEYLFDFLTKNSLFYGKEKVLDVGCGSGRLINQAEKSEFSLGEYLGIDRSTELIGEAKKLYPDFSFQILDMRDTSKMKEKYTAIFFIASFHHIDSLSERKQVLRDASELLQPGGYICMTNWALSSGNNQEKYRKYLIKDSKDLFGSQDYRIPFGEYMRYYHDFSLEEFEHLVSKTKLSLVENTVFTGENNILTIFQKEKLK